MIKKLFVTALVCTLPVSAVAQLADVPDAPKVDAKYLIYLHGVGIEKVGVWKANEDYRGIVKAFEKRDFIVISEVRSSDTKPNEYGKKVAGQVKALITKGVPPENITVVGYSKGGLITLWAAGDKVTGKEIKFETGEGHGLFRKPVDQWVNPLAKWASGK